MGLAPGDAGPALEELAQLAQTAGATVAATVVQRRTRSHPATFVGSGKVETIRAQVRETGADLVIFDDELSPAQQRNLERLLATKVLDRTALVLDIFAQRARTSEGRLQVELAQMMYLLPRLAGRGVVLSRLGGGIGTRGPGETKLEVDRRRIRARITDLQRGIGALRQHRRLQRHARHDAALPVVALVGYTNAGKSSLLNRITGAGVLVENALFATLDPTVRRAQTSTGRAFTIADTVGFVRHLPHQLVDAFRSTLEEVAQADLILHVVDASHEDPEGQIAAVREVLHEIGAARVPEIVVLNKADAADPEVLARLLRREPHSVVASARTGEGIDKLLAAVEEDLPRPAVEVDALVPYGRGDLIARVHSTGEMLSETHLEAGTRIVARVDPVLAAALGEFAAA